MPDIETEVAKHYTTGALMRHILNALRTLDIDPDAATPDDLAAVDEFHTGGRRATDDLLAQLTIKPGTLALDIGCGIGGPARHVAHTKGAHVTGVDLTPEFIETARELSALVGLADQTDFHTGSALALPVKDGHFELALLLHVGMNIEDKTTLMAEAKRVLKPGGTFAVFDVMRAEDETTPLAFPLPWSEAAGTSFVTPCRLRGRSARSRVRDRRDARAGAVRARLLRRGFRADEGTRPLPARHPPDDAGDRGRKDKTMSTT